MMNSTREQREAWLYSLGVENTLRPLLEEAQAVVKSFDDQLAEGEAAFKALRREIGKARPLAVSNVAKLQNELAPHMAARKKIEALIGVEATGEFVPLQKEIDDATNELERNPDGPGAEALRRKIDVADARMGELESKVIDG